MPDGSVAMANPLSAVAPRDRVQRKLSDFAKLEHGWHRGEGEPVSPLIMDAIRKIYRRNLSLGLTNMDAFPGLSGEIMLTIYAKSLYIEVTAEPDGNEIKLSLRAEYDGEREEVWPDQRSVAEVQAQIKRVARPSWTTSASYPSNTTILNAESSKALLSVTHLAHAEAAYLSSKWHVWQQLGHQSAITSGAIILTSRESHPSSGSLVGAKSRRTAA